MQSNVLAKDDTTAPSGKMLILHGPKSMVDAALELARKMDLMRPQVAIEVTIYDISDTALKDLGISWTYGDVNIQEQNNKGVNFGSFARAPLSFNGVIKALEQEDKAKLLASPNVSVLDGERAFILIGDRINYPVLIGYSQNNAPIFSKEEERVGIYMQVAASVSSDDNVTLSLYPQVSSISGFLNVNGASYPQISTREAQTTLRVHSGDTIVMGGLLKSEDTASYDRIPFLSQLPFIGELFRHRKTNKDSSQVIISIKPKVIRSDESR
jgi:type IV pilus assembly protein PilQ